MHDREAREVTTDVERVGIPMVIIAILGGRLSRPGHPDHAGVRGASRVMTPPAAR